MNLNKIDSIMEKFCFYCASKRMERKVVVTQNSQGIKEV